MFENHRKSLSIASEASYVYILSAWVDKSSSKMPKMVNFGEFLKKACGQIVLPERSILIRQILTENAKYGQL